MGTVSVFEKRKVAGFVIRKEGFTKWGLAPFLYGPIFIIFASITKKLAKKMGDVVGFVPK
jgi:hypothetical protein